MSIPHRWSNAWILAPVLVTGCVVSENLDPLTGTSGSGGAGGVSSTPSTSASTGSGGNPTTSSAGTGGAGGTTTTTSGTGGTTVCATAADCPGADTACATRTCTGGVCGVDLAPNGSLVGTQVTGDCQAVVCDGNGAIITVADDADIPDDGNPCTEDACAGGVASHPLLPLGTICGVDVVCDGAGSCVGCIADDECGASTACVTHRCQAGTCVTEHTPAGTGDPGGQVAGDCKKIVCDGAGGTTTVPDDADVEDDGIPCTLDQCSGGVAQHLSGCGAGLACDGASCVPGCLIGGTFHAPDEVNPANACQACKPAVSTSAWSDLADTTACDDGDPCTKDDQCLSGVCGGTAYSCAVTTSCQASSACDGNGGCTITDLPEGTLCPDAPGAPNVTSPGVCRAGSCELGCFIDGGFVPLWASPSNVCLVCDPFQSRTTWSYNYPLECDDGNLCTYHKRCSQGVCSGDVQAPNGTSCGSGLVCLNGSCVAGP